MRGKEEIRLSHDIQTVFIWWERKIIYLVVPYNEVFGTKTNFYFPFTYRAKAREHIHLKIVTTNCNHQLRFKWLYINISKGFLLNTASAVLYEIKTRKTEF